ncbi:hypothetical protein JXB28_00945 [Candidatus Woesearchaeota archaeon]|nr:hypothetical protein [Candidatus Woesearchaeota archaeon]
MNLVNCLNGILECSEGMKPGTRDKALKETIEYYKCWQQQLLDYAREDYRKGGSYSEYHMRSLELEQSLLKKVLKGETTFQHELSKIIKDPNEHTKKIEESPGGEYWILNWTLNQFFPGIFFDEIEDYAKMMDETIARIYLSKPKKKRKHNPEAWREIL